MENTDTDMWAGRSEMNCSESGRENTTWRQGHDDKGETGTSVLGTREEGGGRAAQTAVEYNVTQG